MPPAAILDVDGTLVETNYHHTIAWYRAFRQNDVVLALWRIHRHMGMGGDQLVKALCGEQIRAAEKVLYTEPIGEVMPLDRARELIEDLKQRGHAVVLSSSVKPEEVEHYVDLLDARELVDEWTTSADVKATKPEPDLIEAAVEKAWDCEAAKPRRSCATPVRWRCTSRSATCASRSTKPRLRQARGHGRQARHLQGEARLREDI